MSKGEPTAFNAERSPRSGIGEPVKERTGQLHADLLMFTASLAEGAATRAEAR